MTPQSESPSKHRHKYDHYFEKGHVYKYVSSQEYWAIRESVPQYCECGKRKP